MAQKHHPWLVFKIVFISFLSFIKVAFRRLSNGPVSPSWGLGIEGAVEATRNALEEMNTWKPSDMQDVAADGFPAKIPSQVRFEDVELAGVPCEFTYIPGANQGAVLLYLHGGGMVLGSPRGHRDVIAQIAVGVNICAYSPDYSLAPQKPFPASLNDVFATYKALIEERNFQAHEIIVAGDSAGAVLTHALLLKLKKEGYAMPAATVALSPAPDLSFAGESWIRNLKTDYLSREIVSVWLKYYASEEEIKTNPLVSPGLGDFEGCPPMLIQAGEGECLYDDIVPFVEKLKLQNVDVTFESYAEMPHVWQLYRAVTPEGDKAIKSISNFILKYIKA